MRHPEVESSPERGDHRIAIVILVVPGPLTDSRDPALRRPEPTQFHEAVGCTGTATTLLLARRRLLSLPAQSRLRVDNGCRPHDDGLGGKWWLHGGAIRSSICSTDVREAKRVWR